MRRTLIVLLALFGGATLIAFLVLLLRAPESRFVLSRFNPTLSEPVPLPLPSSEPLTPGTFLLGRGEGSLTLAYTAEVREGLRGTFALASSSLTLTQSTFGDWGGHGTFTLAMDSLTFEQDTEINLHSTDFFATQQYREATLTVTNLAQHGRSAVYTLEGRLTLRGETHDVELPSATLYRRDDTLIFETDVIFDRTQWGITHASPSFSGILGSAMLSDLVSLTLRAEFPMHTVEP
ncbi:hypothetical protein A3C89_00550 [Candidatus Kaiserbacteria bacterium RIFCSPHIGHO2_02_FULL_50_50]|uniref:Lipid/polyisoprenoid-binding YceI-like domain-containing protein n=1 Tax=Candidatus Kaiserbacteria bacterium RIFCSPHIGHO2_02_FULL_50_50 TaxID=1798492 RepID=A0A1F6DGS6_9BACT|nr:MAG: hypothetical protein A3C89_00550 [Candidatus Kaiserbacteria bacterium RIFCSPHIGHO2_02_FULL_50_50]OGG88846.1 MAG: hypothetical protein A3G62_02990 [Candidatus Kaiserbacteria bacterium RIFCSPLOWO2_12_FULL_50_10]